MKKQLRLRKLAMSVATAGILLSATGAHAAIPANTGYDGVINLIRGSGSDTTYLPMQKIEAYYNASPGCTLDPTASGTGFNSCNPAFAATDTVTDANYDHDEAVSDYPIGSGNGIKMLTASAAGTSGHPVDYARSSRDKQASDPTGLTFAAYAKDGIAVVTFKGRTTASFTKVQLQGIFVNCTITTWGQIYGNGDTTPIRPYGIQTGSGTYKTFSNYLGGDPDACANAIGPNRILFENETSPIDNNTQKDAGGNLYNDAANAVWWMSFGPYSANPAKAGTASAWQVEGNTISFATIFNNSYPITRYLWHVTLTSADSATSGQAGATRAFRDWICKTNAQHVTPDPDTGKGYGQEISAALQQYGFLRLPSAEADAGTLCKKQFT